VSVQNTSFWMTAPLPPSSEAVGLEAELPEDDETEAKLPAVPAVPTLAALDVAAPDVAPSLDVPAREGLDAPEDALDVAPPPAGCEPLDEASGDAVAPQAAPTSPIAATTARFTTCAERPGEGPTGYRLQPSARGGGTVLHPARA